MADFRVERIQTGVRLEKRLVKVLKALADHLDMSLGDLIEGMALHNFDGLQPFSAETRDVITRLTSIYGLDLDATHSHRLSDIDPESAVPFVAAHRSFSHPIEVDLPAAAALDLFTPLGERLWIAAWDPTFLHPTDGATMPGLVFTTGKGAELTFWTVADFDRAGGHALYTRVTPASRSVVVEVQVRSIGADACEVEVGYELTGLTAQGNSVIEAMSDASYAQMIERWADLIADHLRTRGSEQT